MAKECLLSHWEARVNKVITEMFEAGHLETEHLELPMMKHGDFEARVQFMREYISMAYCIAKDSGLKMFIDDYEFEDGRRITMLPDEAYVKAENLIKTMEKDKSSANICFAFVPNDDSF